MSNNSDFQIEDGVLIRYTGKDKDVVIPDSVTKIGDRAFKDCTSLTSITIPNRVTWIGKYVFYGCQNIKIAVSDEKYFVVGSYEGTGKDIIAARKILQTRKLD